MKTVQQIIDLLGGLDALKTRPIRLTVEGFMPLVIEYIGIGPRGWPKISVAHYYEQEGDLMCDPDMTLEVNEGTWHPVEFQMANPPIYQEAVVVGEDGQVVIKPKLLADLNSFAEQWDRNLKDQGFLDAAEHLAQAPRQGP